MNFLHNTLRYAKFFSIGAAALLLIGCGSGGGGGGGNSVSKSTLNINFEPSDLSQSNIGGLALKINYDASAVSLPSDINSDPSKGITLGGGLDSTDTLMSVNDENGSVKINLIKADGFKGGNDSISIKFNIIKGTPDESTYAIDSAYLFLSDLDGKNKAADYSLNKTVANGK